MRLPTVLASLFLTAAVAAQPVTLNAFDRGWYSQAGFHNPANDNYFAGDTSRNADPMGELRNWFVFDLTALTPRQLVGARLELSSTFWFTDTGSETYRLTSLAFDRAALTNGTGGVSAFNALGTGTTFGEFTRTGFINGPLVIDLNQLFMDSLPYGGWLLLSGRLTTLTPEGAMFGSSSQGESGGQAMPRLILDDGRPPIPLPHAAALASAGLALLAAQRLRPRIMRA